MAVQTNGFGVHHCFVKVIPSAHSAELQVFFDKHIAKDANIRTDGWKGYTTMKERFSNLNQEVSAKGRAFPLMHRQIMMFKAWLRVHTAIAHTCKSILMNFAIVLSGLNTMIIYSQVDRTNGFHSTFILSTLSMPLNALFYTHKLRLQLSCFFTGLIKKFRIVRTCLNLLLEIYYGCKTTHFCKNGE